MKAGSPSNGPFLTPLFYRRPKFKFSQRKNVFLTVGLPDDVFLVLASARTTEKNKEKTNIGKTFIKKKTKKEKIRTNEKLKKTKKMKKTIARE